MPSELDKALESNISKEIKGSDSASLIPTPPTREAIIADAEDDYAFARDQLKRLITQSNDSIELAGLLAADSENPRVFEVHSTMIKQNAEMTGELLDLLKKRKDLNKSDIGNPDRSGGTINNTVYVGTTTDLAKMLDNIDDDVIDV